MWEDPFRQGSLLAFPEQRRSAGRQLNGTGSRSSLGIPDGQLAALFLMDGAADLQRIVSFIKVLPLQPADLTPTQTGSQFRVEEVTPDTVPLNSLHELFSVVHPSTLFSVVAEFGRVDIFCWILWNEDSLLRSPYRRM